MNDFTKGPHHAVLHCEQIDIRSREKPFEMMVNPAHYVECNDEITCDAIKNYHDAKLYATAGTTATKLAEQGYDAVKVLEVLPELVRVIQDLPSHELIGEALDEALEQCRGES